MTDPLDVPESESVARPLTQGQSEADASDLRSSLCDLAALVNGSLGLPDLLERVAVYAAHAIPGADGAVVTLLRVDRPDNRVEALAASHPSGVTQQRNRPET